MLLFWCHRRDGRYHLTVLPGFWLRAEWVCGDTFPNLLKTLQGLSPEVAQALRDALFT